MFQMTEERAEMLSMLSDMSKDAYGFRLRSDYFAEFTMEQLHEEAEKLQRVVVESIEQEAREHELAIVSFEEYISKMMSDHRIDRKTAIRWDMEAEEVSGDVGFYCWKKHLPYTYESKLMGA